MGDPNDVQTTKETKTTNNMQNAKKEKKGAWGHLILGLTLSIIFDVFSFPSAVINVGKTQSWTWIQNAGITAQALLSKVFGASNKEQAIHFNQLGLVLIVSLVLYLLALVLLSHRHKKYAFLGMGLLGILIGIFFWQELTWLIYILGWLAWLSGLFFIGMIVSIKFLIGIFWWLPLLLLTIAILALIFTGGYKKKLVQRILIGTVSIFALGGLSYLVTSLLPSIQHGLTTINGIKGIFAGFSLSLLIVLAFLIIAILYALCFNGFLLIRQIKGALKAGNETTGVVLGAIGIGTSLAFILVETNFINNVLLFPTGMRTFFLDNIYQLSPDIDIAITIGIIMLSIVGVLLNVGSLKEEPTVKDALDDFKDEFLGSVVGLIFSLLAKIQQDTDHHHHH